ncbi:MAG: lamin tail domain-containing protein [Deltaproteobacteria bacterium]|nr:lamin tail domain-containing protein [Deltaproteobacteria bacterium]
MPLADHRSWRALAPAVALLLALFAAAAFTGCSSGDGGGAICTVPAGALVITEILPNPVGKDTGAEWFEVYNSSSAPVDLRGVRIGLLDGGSLKRHSIAAATAVTLAPGEYALVASGQTTPAPLYEYGDSLGEFSNTDSTVTLTCSDGTELDRACYGGACEPSVAAPLEGKSFALILAGPPSADANDDPRNWAAVDPTPAADNPDQDPIVIVEPPAPCEGATAPTTSSVVITEVMANPVGSDSDREWLEIRVDGPGCVDLAGVRLTTDLDQPKGGVVLAADTGLTAFAAGAHYVIAGRIADLGSAPVAQRVAIPSLGNNDGSVALWSGSAKIAEAHYGTPEEGKAQQLDDSGGFCVATAPMDDGVSFGTPGEANPPCGACFCKGQDGKLQSVTSVGPGEMMVTEVLADVPGKEDENALREWFEAVLLPGTSGPRSLACLAVGTKADASGDAIVNPEQACLMVSPGDQVVFGRTKDTTENGGLAVDVIYDGTGLTGSGGLVLRRNDGAVVDVVTTYGSSSDGVARQIGPALVEAGDASANDEGDAWCDALPVYDAVTGARGTPGAPNLGCTGCFCQDTAGGWVEGTAPEAGDLVITEVFADVPGSETTNGGFEWFEVWSAASGERQLNCLMPQVTGSGSPSKGKRISEGVTTCQPISPGDYAVFCHDAASATAQSLGPCTPYDGPALVGTGTLALLDDAGDTVAQAVYDTGADGVSTQLAGAMAATCDYTPADAGLLWCDAPAAEVYASIDDPSEPGVQLEFVGTPGEANPCCPATP